MNWLIAHLIGDFLLQIDWMADKKKSAWPCTGPETDGKAEDKNPHRPWPCAIHWPWPCMESQADKNKNSTWPWPGTELQKDGKENSPWACTAHVAAYMLPFLLFVDLTWQQFILIAGQHWIQDRTQIVKQFMVHVAGQKNFAENKTFFPWGLILHDNIWHLVWLYLIIEIGIPL